MITVLDGERRHEEINKYGALLYYTFTLSGQLRMSLGYLPRETQELEHKTYAVLFNGDEHNIFYCVLNVLTKSYWSELKVNCKQIDLIQIIIKVFRCRWLKRYSKYSVRLKQTKISGRIWNENDVTRVYKIPEYPWGRGVK